MQQRKSNRLKGYDYSTTGAYFVTVCAHDRFKNRNVFGIIRDGEIMKNDWAAIVEFCWRDLSNHYPCVALDELVVMPDHFHGIVWINEKVGNGLKPFPTEKKYGLPEIIRGFKTFSARRINEINIHDKFQWQKSYYDHVIRNEESLQIIREYIQNNPKKWELDHDADETKDIQKIIDTVGNGLKPFPTQRQWMTAGEE